MYTYAVTAWFHAFDGLEGVEPFLEVLGIFAGVAAYAECGSVPSGDDVVVVESWVGDVCVGYVNPCLTFDVKAWAEG